MIKSNTTVAIFSIIFFLFTSTLMSGQIIWQPKIMAGVHMINDNFQKDKNGMSSFGFGLDCVIPPKKKNSKVSFVTGLGLTTKSYTVRPGKKLSYYQNKFGFTIPEEDLEVDFVEIEHFNAYLQVPVGIKIQINQSDRRETYFNIKLLNDFYIAGDPEYGFYKASFWSLLGELILFPFGDGTNYVPTYVDDIDNHFQKSINKYHPAISLGIESKRPANKMAFGIDAIKYLTEFDDNISDQALGLQFNLIINIE